MTIIKTCTACNGTGIYDNTGSPKCSACNGLGIDRGHMPYRLWKHVAVKYYHIDITAIEMVYERIYP